MSESGKVALIDSKEIDQISFPVKIGQIRISKVRDTYHVDNIISRTEYKKLFSIKDGNLYFKRMFISKEVKNEDIESLYLEAVSIAQVNKFRRDYLAVFFYKSNESGKKKRLFECQESDSKLKDKEYDLVFKKRNIELISILGSILNKEASYKQGMLD